MQRHQDHPRRCGENRNVIEFENRLPGSPPQVRGKLSCGISGGSGAGITPAGAGKTLYWLSRWAVCRDHPRRCGENMQPPSGRRFCPGSPPQVRGKLLPPVNNDVGIRITPAGAGKTAIRSRRNANAWDHPRRCGENKNRPQPTFGDRGSPPQVRGKHPRLRRLSP